MDTISFDALLKMRYQHRHHNAKWVMSCDMFQHIRGMRDHDDNHVYPRCWDTDSLPPLLGLPITVLPNSEYVGISIAPISTRTTSDVTIIGGKRNGERIKWFGNRVNIDGERHILNRVYLTDGTRQEYYVIEDMTLTLDVTIGTTLRIEVCK